ncbi:hypothetical protein RND71_037044 [Anisodus tanguticus]|uniref:Uncharacterized protein n=1 Tax=Anisodus tanguticus TaxID=243964 RepID=A0AAE1R2B4_9SOLA|nr:hypothetical protein RND71_037044 [Anisodus tanguticus]
MAREINALIISHPDATTVPPEEVRPPVFNDLNTRVPYVEFFVSSHVHNLLSESMTVGPRIVKFH